jgi:cytochrome c
VTKHLIAPILGLVAGMLTVLPAQAQDATQGQQVFKQQCALCHDVAPGKNRVGPTLAGIVGRQSGSVPGFQYSEGNKKAGITWNAESLAGYLQNPRGVVPGTKMAYAGLKDDKKRGDLVAYLATLH